MGLFGQVANAAMSRACAGGALTRLPVQTAPPSPTKGPEPAAYAQAMRAAYE